MVFVPTESSAEAALAGEGIAIEFCSLAEGEDSTAFRTLNEEWITRYFKLEGKDRETLSDPETTILRKGGRVYLACRGHDVVGCVALIPVSKDVYEVSKMAVLPSLRGKGIGRQLLHYAIEQAKAINAKLLCLGSSKILKNAVHLYESCGFQHVPPERLPWLAYERADVFMELKVETK